ncbi:MAG TPA: protein kinase [Cellulomonas sp.]
MTPRREASRPPRIPGYTHRRLLGGGGSADVFLYDQERPRRAVAVKVLLGTVDDAAREAFEREADLTARVAHHPSIVSVYQAGVADDGRPYLVMEYCSRPGLGPRYRTERFSVAEVLQIGVRLASAVETAHRAGILHRDIKPGNVLTNDFGRPVLSDFGIASSVESGGAAVGMSIPWAAPELLATEPHGDERSDVYSLAATLFSALAGRSPFERPGGGNEAADLVGRIERGAPAPLTRDDVPDRLRTVLARAMARDPWQRHVRAADLARDLQAVEADLGLPVTPLELGLEDDTVPRVPGAPLDGGAADATRARSVVEVAPRGVAPVGTGAGASGLAGPGAVSSAAPASVGEDGATRLRPVLQVRTAAGPTGTTGPAGAGPTVAPAAPVDGDQVRLEVQPGTAPARRTGRVLAAVGSAVVLLGAVVAVVVLAQGGDDPTPTPTGGEFLAPAATVAATVPSPTNLVGTRSADGTVEFTWTNPAEQDGDQYLWGVRTATGQPTLELVTEPRVVVTPDAEGQVCIEVSIVREDRRTSVTPAEECAP